LSQAKPVVGTRTRRRAKDFEESAVGVGRPVGFSLTYHEARQNYTIT